uniref:Sodium/nucleoside cotransporter n=1 Tax=Myripristis murdjan TaxID=586833 RepID=A0A668AT27_9TELE
MGSNFGTHFCWDGNTALEQLKFSHDCTEILKQKPWLKSQNTQCMHTLSKYETCFKPSYNKIVHSSQVGNKSNIMSACLLWSSCLFTPIYCMFSINSKFVSGFIAMVIAACILNFYQAIGLLVITLVTAFFLLWDWMMERYGDRVWEELSPVRDLFNRNWFWIRWVVCVLLLVGVVCWLALDTAKQGTRQLVSFAGLLVFIFLMVVFSKSPFRISWQTLLWGTGLQFVFGLLILRTKYGYIAVEWLGKQAEIFLSYADVGSEFVFGESYADHMFAFKVMPVLVFFSTVISILYYVGFMPWLILKIGFIMQVTMGTSPTESMAAAGNIFLGQTESPLLIRPYISQLTRSEIHAVMTGGFASIAGSVMGAFIAFGIESSHLLSASIMSAPASLAISKTFWPETETPCVTVTSSIKLDKGDSKNMLEAASNGASSAAGLVANVITNIIAFLALLAFLDAALSWLGAMFDYPQLSFSVICSYLFMPLAFMMGVSWEDSFIVGELIGLKTVFNEFVAYQKLSELINKRKAGGPEYVDNVKQYISVHSETIATYALCGFANFASLGMMVGALSGMAPERSTDISNCGIRALIAGSVSSFMTACIAGELLPLLCGLPPLFLCDGAPNIGTDHQIQANGNSSFKPLQLSKSTFLG